MIAKPITSKPVYDYLMGGDENFIIDKKAALVVRQIYSLFLAGNGPTKIARMLTEQQIHTPGTLEYREYTGCLVNLKTDKVSYKLKHSIENPPEKQVIFENHHEPSIDRETGERMQELRRQEIEIYYSFVGKVELPD